MTVIAMAEGKLRAAVFTFLTLVFTKLIPHTFHKEGAEQENMKTNEGALARLLEVLGKNSLFFNVQKSKCIALA